MENSPSNKTSRQNLGNKGEDIACEWYLENGFEIVDRNVHIKRVGEIDIVASQSVQNEIAYIFSEVKARRGSSAGFGYESVNHAKLIRMRKCAISWIGENVEFGRKRISWRLDVVSIDMSENPPVVSVFENVEVD